MRKRLCESTLKAARELASLIEQIREAVEGRKEDSPITEEALTSRAFDLGFSSCTSSLAPVLFWDKTELIAYVHYKGERLIIRFVAFFPTLIYHSRVPAVHCLLVSIPRDDSKMMSYNMDIPIAIESMKQLEECMAAVMELSVISQF